MHIEGVYIFLEIRNMSDVHFREKASFGEVEVMRKDF